MSGAEKFGVLVVDDHPIMRLGIVAIINAQKDMTVCAQAGSGEDAVRMFRQHRPDVTLMDLRLPRHERPGGHTCDPARSSNGTLRGADHL